MDLNKTQWENMEYTGLAQGHILTNLTSVMLNLWVLLLNSLI